MCNKSLFNYLIGWSKRLNVQLERVRVSDINAIPLNYVKF